MKIFLYSLKRIRDYRNTALPIMLRVTTSHLDSASSNVLIEESGS